MKKIKEKIKEKIFLMTSLLRKKGDAVSKNYEYDERIFRRYARPGLEGTSTKVVAGSGGGYSKEHLRALLTMEYHRIEKGLALPQPRYGFGCEVIQRLVGLLKIYRKSYGDDGVTQNAYSALFGYLDFHDSRHDNIEPEVLVEIRECLKGVSHESGARGIALKARVDVQSRSDVDYTAFCTSRHSIRDFDAGEVDGQLIEASVNDAMTTPSVCNRQSSRLIFTKDPAMMAKVLELQNGNRGFGDSIGGLFVVYYDISNFVSPGERNQGWVDSGMFSMNLVFALHSRGIGSCCLNWSADMRQDEKLVGVLELDQSSRVVMLIAVGNLKESFHVAVSKKFTASEIMKIV
jgi:nitroreductase